MKAATYEQAAIIFDKMSLSADYPEILTLPLYEAMEEAIPATSRFTAPLEPRVQPLDYSESCRNS